MEQHELDKLDKWKRWAREIHSEVSDLVLRRTVWIEVVEIVQSNPEAQKPSVFYDWLPTVYAQTQAICIRRIADSSRSTISLANLMQEFQEFRTIVEAFAAETPLVVADDTLVRNIPDAEADLKSLRAATEPVKTYVDKRVAHHDKRGSRYILRQTDLENATKIICDLTATYHVFLHDTYQEFEPTFAYDWKAIFRVPWIRRNS